MDTDDIRRKVAEHFYHAPHGTGQFFHGDWFAPKDQDSLELLLGDISTIDKDFYIDRIKLLEFQVDEKKEEIEKLKGDIQKILDGEEAA